MREILGYVAESDLDLVLLMDARANGPLVSYLFKCTGIQQPPEFEARRSTLRSGGRETDVEISWPTGAILIEDKLDAGFTVGQPSSYAAEIARLRENKRFQASAVLICPARRLTHYQLLARDEEGRDCFDAFVTCAELAEKADAYASRTGDGLARGAALVMRAAEEPRGVGLGAEDPVRSAWGDEYRNIVAEFVPPAAQLTVGPKGLRTATASTAIFPSAGIDPPSVWVLAHDLPDGQVRMDLMLDGDPINVPSGASVVKKRQMTWLVWPVPPITFEKPASLQRDAIQAAVTAALELRRWASEHAQVASPPD